jgi:demethylmenaquinone methyltransferase / 2-methoxy-6-polyprenyl-1,4-benzoquinol methylase
VATTAEAPPLRFDDETRRKRGRRVARMFDRIAPTYDVLNHLLSANVDARWRRQAVRALGLTGKERVLDACSGTGDLALALLDGGAREVDATDFAPEMLKRAEAKTGGRARLRVADTTALPFADGTFDAATVGFGVRNLQDLDAGLRELCRVLKPGGRLCVLEFSRARNPVFRGLFHVYFMLILPLIGNLVSGGADNAYAYLPRSVLAFPGPDALAERLKKAGFARVDVTSLTFGIACLHVASKAT